MLRAFAALCFLGLLATPATACPVNSECLKYRRHMPPPRITVKVTGYMRSVPATPPAFNHRRIAQFLAASTWQPQYVAGPGLGVPPAIRFVDARTVRRPVVGNRNERLVNIRQLARRNGVTMVEVDGAVFALERCQYLPRRWTACLTPRTDLSFDEPELDEELSWGGVGYGGSFAKPPPN